MLMVSKKERREKHCCKDCVKKHVSCPVAGEIALYAVSCIHKTTITQSEEPLTQLNRCKHDFNPYRYSYICVPNIKEVI